MTASTTSAMRSTAGLITPGSTTPCLGLRSESVVSLPCGRAVCLPQDRAHMEQHWIVRGLVIVPFLCCPSMMRHRREGDGGSRYPPVHSYRYKGAPYKRQRPAEESDECGIVFFALALRNTILTMCGAVTAACESSACTVLSAGMLNFGHDILVHSFACSAA